MKRGFLVEQCTYDLFECLHYVNEITKKHTLAVSGEFCGFFALAKFDFRSSMCSSLASSSKKGPL